MRDEMHFESRRHCENNSGVETARQDSASGNSTWKIVFGHPARQRPYSLAHYWLALLYGYCHVGLASPLPLIHASVVCTLALSR